MNTLLDYHSLPDRRLVELHLDGDRDAFRQIVERHQAMVCALGLSACGDIARSEDIAQEVFVAAWKQLPDLREPEKLRGWLAGITRNLVNNSFRRAARTPTARAELLSAETPEETAGPREHAISADESALMWSALEGISATYREPMILFYREQRSVTAVAEALEISEEAARQRLARGRALLSERMAKLVEETLERSAPTPAFAGMVLLALPSGFAPLVVAEAGVAGTKVAAGGTMTKTVVTAGAIGGAVAKGSAVIKVLSAVAFLPAVLQGATDFIRFSERNANVADAAARREAAKAYLWGNAGIGMFVLGVMFFAPLVRPSWPTFVVIGVWAIGSVWLSVRARCRMERLMAGVPKPKAGETHGFELLSDVTLLGLPLYHVRLATRPNRRAPAVKGWIAISDGRAVGGLFAFGPFAIAPVSMGIVGVGVISVSVAALGAAALGIVAAGLWSQGLVSAGLLAAKGIMAVAPFAASLNAKYASGAGEAVRGFFEARWFYRFTKMSAWVLVWAGVLGWVMPVALTGWQLWRTRPAK